MTPADFSINFGLGLAGSLHCVQMCGPIVLSFGLPLAGWPRPRQAAGHILYHSGRIATYSLLGAVAGTFGNTLKALTPYQNAASLTAGALMLLAGLLMLGAIRRPSLIQIRPAAGLSRRAARFLTTPTLPSKLRVGALLGLLPCGLVYAALLKAIAPANALDGALTMFAFGLGTAGPLLALGIFSSAVTRSLSQWGTRLSAAAVTAMGLFLLLRGLLPVTMAHHVHPH
jgi:sulfite exporter TauE/SafE